MTTSPTPPVKLAVAAFDQSTFFNTDIENANGAVRIVVLEESFGRIDFGNPNFLSRTNDWINRMRAEGQLVLGYIPCNSGESDPASIVAGVTDTSGNPTVSGVDTWYQRYPQMDGIYLDEGPQYDASHVSAINGQTIQTNYTAYNQAIQQYTYQDTPTSPPRNWRVMIEAANYPDDWILSVAEFILLWEGPASRYTGILQAGYQGTNGPYNDAPNWWFNVPNWGTTTGPERIVHTIYEYTPPPPVPPQTTVDVLKAFLATVQGYGAGSVYAARESDPGKLLPEWNDLVTAVLS